MRLTPSFLSYTHSPQDFAHARMIELVSQMPYCEEMSLEVDSDIRLSELEAPSELEEWHHSRGRGPYRDYAYRFFTYALEGVPQAHLSVSQGPDGKGVAQVVAVSQEVGYGIIAKFHALLPKRPAPPQTSIYVYFHYMSSTGPTSIYRLLEVPRWSAIRDNYGKGCQKALDELVGLKATSMPPGRILVFSGPPGTGKTTFLRALASEWRDWCDTSVVVDPDQFFTRAEYMVQTILTSSSEATNHRWRLLILEDTEEYLVPNSKSTVGQALARLLNLGDGFVGQGLRLLLGLTTNAPIAKLNEAITRPGRCLSNIEIPRLSPAESCQWLHAHGVETQGKERTLADCYAALTEGQVGDGIEDRRHGVYL